MANLYPAVGIAYHKKCKRHYKRKDKGMITAAFLLGMVAVLFVGEWTVRFQIWGAMILLYFALVM